MVKLVRVDEALSSQVRGQRAAGKLSGQRAVGIIDLQRCGLGTMRTALCANKLAELRHIHGGVACSVQPGKASAFMHKADKAAQYLWIGENLAVGAVHKY